LAIAKKILYYTFAVMKLAVLLLLISAMQATPPAQRNAPDTSAETLKHVGKGVKADQDLSARSPVTIKATRRRPAESDIEGQYSEKDGDSVVVRQFPPVAITRDWVDRGVWVFSFLLVVVGAFQAVLLWRTLGAIRRQAGIMEDNMKLVINKERMRISLEVLPLLPPENDGGLDANIGTVPYRLRFSGQTRAVVIASCVTAEVTDYSDPNFGNDGLSWGVSSGTVFEPSLTVEEHSASVYNMTPLVVDFINNRKSFLHFFGYFRYQDVFERERETVFCYTWHPRAPFPAIGGDGWVKSGPTNANHET
jgi:hypothetical protein